MVDHSIELDAADAERVRALAEIRGCEPSEVVEAATEAYLAGLDEETRGQAQSLYAASQLEQR